MDGPSAATAKRKARRRAAKQLAEQRPEPLTARHTLPVQMSVPEKVVVVEDVGLQIYPSSVEEFLHALGTSLRHMSCQASGVAQGASLDHPSPQKGKPISYKPRVFIKHVAIFGATAGFDINFHL